MTPTSPVQRILHEEREQSSMTKELKQWLHRISMVFYLFYIWFATRSPNQLLDIGNCYRYICLKHFYPSFNGENHFLKQFTTKIYTCFYFCIDPYKSYVSQTQTYSRQCMNSILEGSISSVCY